ncbi:MAG: formylglycine-generating enzyme family protein [Polyangiaceae bacterium]
MRNALALSLFFCAASTAVFACTKEEARVGSASTTNAALPAVATTELAAIEAPGAPEAAPKKPEAPSACPDGMILVDGMYCPSAEEKCLEWMEPPNDRYAHFRCARYAEPATCKGERVHQRFCIGATEELEADTKLPQNKKSYEDAEKICAANGERVCTSDEWQFACEGEEMQPYPYGWQRDANACNVDIMKGLGHVGRLVDHRSTPDEHPNCVSPFGVHDMAGNVAEWVTDTHAPKKSQTVMKGAWWLPGKHACRDVQRGHNAIYAGTETGVRCCKDAPETEVSANAK